MSEGALAAALLASWQLAILSATEAGRPCLVAVTSILVGISLIGLQLAAAERAAREATDADPDPFFLAALYAPMH